MQWKKIAKELLIGLALILVILYAYNLVHLIEAVQ